MISMLIFSRVINWCFKWLGSWIKCNYALYVCPYKIMQTTLTTKIFKMAVFIPLIYFTFKLGLKSLLNLYFIFFLICLQGFIGWYMVLSGLVDSVDVSHYRLSIHLVLAFVILSLIFWNYLFLQNI